MCKMHMTLYTFQHVTPRSIGNGWLGINHSKDPRAAREAAHEPGNHEAEGTHRRCQQEYILRYGYQFSKAELVAGYRNAADPYNQHRNNIEYEHHQRLVPGREPNCAQVQLWKLTVFRVESAC